MYLNGKAGVTADTGRALGYFLNAAEQGYPPSCCNLGKLFLKESGSDADFPTAMAWFRKGAVQGNADSQYHLSLMYMKGQSVKIDLVEAYMWLDLAVKQDHRGALKTRGAIAKQLSPSEIDGAEKRIENWKPANS